MDADPPCRIVPVVLLATGMLSALAANAGIWASLVWVQGLSLPAEVHDALLVLWFVHPLVQPALALPVGFVAARSRRPLGAGVMLGAVVAVPLYMHAVRWWRSLNSMPLSPLELRLFELYNGR